MGVYYERKITKNQIENMGIAMHDTQGYFKEV